MLLLSGLAFLGSDFSFSASLLCSLSARETLGVLLTLEMSLLRPEVSGLAIVVTVAVVARGGGWLDQVGVTVLTSSLVVGWWMMGGMLGEVGEGRVSLSLNTALLALSRPGSFSLLRIEDWETPVEGALAMRLAALGVAVWRMGLLMVGLTRAVGGLVLTGEEGGEDMTGEEEVVTTGETVVGEAVEGSLLEVVAVVLVVVVVVVVVDSGALLVWEKGDTVTVVTGLVLLGSDFLRKGDWTA